MRRRAASAVLCARLPACALLAALLASFHQQAAAHEADAAGGLFRSFDAGATWTPINPGIFASGALGIAVDPRDPNHLLLATDSGLWRSRNGGRDWVVEAPDVLAGPAFAVAFDTDGKRALVAGGAGLFENDGNGWRSSPAPWRASPARALVAGSVAGRVFLAGRSGLHRSDDWGRSWMNVAGAIKADAVDAVLVSAARPADIYVVAGGSVWSSTDRGENWQSLGRAGASNPIEAVSVDADDPARLWAVVGGQLFRSEPGGGWRALGKPLPDTPPKARALTVSHEAMLVATDRGVFRSTDGGEHWELLKESLPGHLAAGVLARAARSPSTLYAGFSLTSYEELAARAQQKNNAALRSTLAGIAGGAALVMLIVFAAIRAMRHAGRRRGPGLPASRSLDGAPQ